MNSIYIAIRKSFGQVRTAVVHTAVFLFLISQSSQVYANTSTENLNDFDRIIKEKGTDNAASKNIDADLKRLKTLSLSGTPKNLSDFALRVYRKYSQTDYESDEQFGDTMLLSVSAFTETQEISNAFSVIERLQNSVHYVPSVYLDYIIDRSLVKIYTKTSDFERALELKLQILNTPDYTSLDIFRQWEPSLFYEIISSYIRLGDGKRALQYLDQSKILHPSGHLQTQALHMGSRGQAYLLEGNYAAAEEAGQEVLELGQVLRQDYFSALGYRLIGNAAHNLGQHEKAEKMLKRGTKLVDTHNFEALKKDIYHDYTVSLESLGLYQEALIWQRKQFLFEINTEKSNVALSQSLLNAENNAFENHREVLILRQENKAQRDIADKDHKIKKLLTIVALVLFLAIGIIIYFYNSLRRKQKKIIRQALDLEDTNDKLQLAALKDSLTDLPNRIFIKSHLDRELKSAKIHKGKVGVIHIDIDHFKEINDTYGHTAGDFVLIEIAKRMEACKGESTVFARIGGDEFLAVISGFDDLESATKEIRVLLDSISLPLNFEGITLVTSASIGVSIYPTDGVNSLDLIVNADLALYEAKQDGRGCIRFFDSSLREILNKRKLLEAELIKGLAEGHIKPYFQPQVNIATNEVCGVEALIRWNHETRGSISPDAFLPVAESAGLMVSLGRFLMEAAIKEVSLWHSQNISFGRLALNASATELGEDDFVDWLLATAKQYNLPTNMLSIEILETVIIEDTRLNLNETLKSLRQEGVHVELDDFGTGYASLQQVKADEIDRLKIDKSFIQNLNTDKSKAVIVRAIVEMASNLNIDIIAEGAETIAELETLLTLGCVKVQGYGIAMPMPGKATRDWIQLFTPNIPIESVNGGVKIGHILPSRGA